MKNFLLILLCFICIGKSYSQTSVKTYGKIVVEIIKGKKPKNIYSKVKIISPFTGGDSAWVQTVEKNINRSILDIKKVKRGKYIVSVNFIVDKNGNLSDIKCEIDPGFELCNKIRGTIIKLKPSPF